MKCVFKVLCSLGFALGVLISLMYVRGMDPACYANWTVFAWGLIGFAIGALISMVIGKACGGSSCETKHHHH